VPENKKSGFGTFQSLNGLFYAQYEHDAAQVVHREDDCHLSAHLFFAFQQGVVGALTPFDRSEGMLHDCLPPLELVPVAQDALAVLDHDLFVLAALQRPALPLLYVGCRQTLIPERATGTRPPTAERSVRGSGSHKNRF